MIILCLIAYFGITCYCLARSVNVLYWELLSVVYLALNLWGLDSPLLFTFPLMLFIVLASVCIHSSSFRMRLSAFIFKKSKDRMPHLSKTEEEALNAGDTWFEKGLFIGEPDWDQLSQTNTALTQEEQLFMTEEVNMLCSMLNEWDIKQDQDLPESVWQYIKEKGFLGLVIPKSYGGKGFSPRAHSEIVMKIATRSTVAAVTVMVPNSLGPGELLYYYGTEAQKSYYLPRLSVGEDIPCFALTEPEAGSDATSIQSEAIVIQYEQQGQSCLGLKLTLNKRWITLAPVATLIGLAVDLKDPEGLLQGIGMEGITCLLISHKTPGLEIGHRHLPAGQPFMNGTIRGQDLIVPIDSIIGGQIKAGHGWQMLVECLSIGRSISLPALGVASSSVAYLTSSAFASIRRQFNVPLAQFEGIQERLAEIGGLNYIVNATRLLTIAAVQTHHKPSVASGITKYFNTELARLAVNYAMDIHGGRTVVEGPRNYLMNYYQGIPISVTVEGANIMTRNLLIFGQGSMACHPYIRDEFYAISNQDLTEFSSLLWSHIHYFLKNFGKTVCAAWTQGRWLAADHRKHPLKRAYQQVERLSCALAWVSDVSLIVLGGQLKRKERLSARLADVMSYLYLATAVLHAHERHRGEADDRLHAEWAVHYCLYEVEQAFAHLFENFPNRFLGRWMAWMVLPYGQRCRYPSDRLSQALAQLMTQNNSYRNRLREMIFLSGSSDDAIDKVERAFQLLLKHQALYQRARKAKRWTKQTMASVLEELVSQQVISVEEHAILIEIEQARWDSILVDEFTFESMKKKRYNSVIKA